MKPPLLQPPFHLGTFGLLRFGFGSASVCFQVGFGLCRFGLASVSEELR